MGEGTLPTRLFGTNGVRGIVGSDLTPDLVMRIGAAFGSMRPGKIAVGRDTRTSGEMLLHAALAGLLSTGCQVTDCGILPTPALQHFVRRKEFSGGVMITASHNPPEYNGVKVIESDGTEMGDDQTLELEQRLSRGSFTVRHWEEVLQAVPAPDCIDQYISAVISYFPAKPGTGMLVAVDPGSGPACRTTPEILRRIGCRVLTVNGVMDGTFPGRLPEPDEQGLKTLSDLVVSSGAAFGVAHDGDADRAVFVDENGTYIEENLEFALIARMICRQKKGLVVIPVSTSQTVEAVVREKGSRVVYTKVGSINVARTMHALIANGEPVIFGGEGNGGLIYPDHQFCRDGGMTAAMMVSILAYEKSPLSVLASRLPRRHMLKGKVATEDAPSVIAELTGQFQGDTLDQLDGVKIIRGATWALVRASGTEPLIRIIIESDDPGKASDFYEELMIAINRSLEKQRS